MLRFRIGCFLPLAEFTGHYTARVGAAARPILRLVRHRLLAIPKAVEAMRLKLNLPADAQAPLKVLLGTLLPPDEGLTKRYEESVNLVTATNPVLGFVCGRRTWWGRFSTSCVPWRFRTVRKAWRCLERWKLTCSGN